ncbi:hypothetical protein [Poseidonocella sp. HB161398]|uniref:hypothetical protein n=1 Tax=Poseidonocella sp. HB161398 TaxID=2320855 RepID=UPI001108A741|nr:hypothetical protein [Poseidonocella sp. HB161398]
MNRNAEPVEVDVAIHEETDAALRVSAAGRLPIWLPRSRIRLETGAGADCTVMATMPRWLAEENGLI